LLLAAFVMVLIYFNVADEVGIFKRWIKSNRYVYLVEALRNFHTGLLMQVLFFSFLRYLVFLLQYIFIFYLFEVNVAVGTVAAVMGLVFLAMAAIPSIALVEVWLRGEISIKLMGLFSLNTLGIGFTSVTVWFINLILPAIVGSLLIINLRLFNKKNENN
jgi:hypothetical protein